MDALHTAAPRPVERPRVISVATALMAGGIAMFFATLLGTYWLFRSEAANSGAEWIAEGTIPLSGPNMMMLTLAMSAVTMQWAFYSIARNDRANASVALALTMVLGVAVANSQFFLYGQMGLGIADSISAVMIYAISGSFLALLAAAMIYLLIIAFRMLGGLYGPHQHGGVAGAAILWYLTIAVYAVIWYGVYISK